MAKKPNARHRGQGEAVHVPGHPIESQSSSSNNNGDGNVVGNVGRAENKARSWAELADSVMKTINECENVPTRIFSNITNIPEIIYTEKRAGVVTHHHSSEEIVIVMTTGETITI